MYKRRDIRETAVQFLYFADLEAGPEATMMEDAFWDMIQEQGLKKLELAKAKAILHVAQGRDGRLAKLNQHSETLIPTLVAAGNADKLADALRKLSAEESRLNSAVDLLRAARQKKSSDAPLTENINAIITANSSLMRQRADFHQLLDDAPQWKQPLEPVTAAIEHLNRISERLGAIDDPNSTVGDFAHLRASSAEITSFREETQSLVHGILSNKDTIDASLAKVIENFTPERVTPVDRAVLRLAAYEITHCDDIPKAVSINEAVEISRKFSTSESSRFINGVLDAI